MVVINSKVTTLTTILRASIWVNQTANIKTLIITSMKIEGTTTMVHTVDLMLVEVEAVASLLEQLDIKEVINIRLTIKAIILLDLKATIIRINNREEESLHLTTKTVRIITLVNAKIYLYKMDSLKVSLITIDQFNSKIKAIEVTSSKTIKATMKKIMIITIRAITRRWAEWTKIRSFT